jgi:SAM-dependent methyltransferase
MGVTETTVKTAAMTAAFSNSMKTARPLRPGFRWADISQAPLHDLPMRDEIIFQYLPLSSDMSVLEVGPGVGFTAFRLAPKVRQMTLLDVTPESISQLRRNLADVPNVQTVCADACSPNLPALFAGPFDVVISLDMFEYLVGEPGACLKNFASVLAPGGRLLLQWPNYPVHVTKAATYIRTRPELDEIVGRAGFKRWTVHALRLRPYANLLYRELHERPLALYRRLRSHHGVDSPQTFDQTWTFQRGRQLERYKWLIHLAWVGLLSAMRLGGDCFECHPVNDGLDGNLLLIAQR